EQVSVASSSVAVQSVAEADDAAAIGSELAGSLYGVNVLFEQVQDKVSNVTRFLVIALQEALPSGNDKTTISFVTSHEPGALVDVLSVFREAGINLSHIDKRPSGRENWQYMFYIDTDAHVDDSAMKIAVDTARSLCTDFHVHGSYPRAERVL
ncbi:MAG: prephenate dehydratase domain-containing protein, partial [Myxococcota bacterium]